MEMIHTFCIKDKIMSITFDNATNNTSAIQIFKSDTHIQHLARGAFFHVRCACHIMNLIVKDGLKLVSPTIKKIRYMYDYIFDSNRRTQEFRKFCKSSGVRCTKQKSDVTHRWNSTYLMLSDACKRKTVLMAFYNTQTEHDLVEEDWQMISDLLHILTVFYDTTKLLSGVYYPTISALLPQLLVISHVFKSYRSHEIWGPLVAEMEPKFRKYYGEMPSIICVASALNPIMSLDGTSSILEDIVLNMNGDNFRTLKETWTTDFQTLYDHYSSLYGNTQTQSSYTPASSSSSSSSKFGLIMQSLAKKPRTSTATLDEVGRYTGTDYRKILGDKGIGIEDLDLLSWWKANQSQYPILAAMARDILTVQASSVASESCFSLAGRILDEKRSSLSKESLELCICYRDWLAASRREQHIINEENSSEDGEVMQETEESGHP